MKGPINPSSDGVDPQSLWRSGAQALREGRLDQALFAFESIIRLGRADATVWFAVALAKNRLGDDAGCWSALDQVLALDPKNVRALMMRADAYASRGEPVAASAFYGAVVRLGHASAPLEPDLLVELRRAERACAEHQEHYETHLRRTLQPRGLDADGAQRVRVSLDLMFGRKRIFLQEPTQHYFPGLPQIEFYPRADAPWLDAVEAATPDIRAELLALLEQEHLFRPYVEREPDRPFFDGQGMVDNPDWSALFLVKDGVVVPDNAARCPRTMAALAGAPLCRIPGRTPSILFSLLRPGARIPPHHGLLNSRLICHLPLIVPDGCGFRVGAETRPWREGQAWLFDDSIEHEAWNDSRQSRIILLFDIWRPELSALERDLMSGLLEATQNFSAALPSLSL